MSESMTVETIRPAGMIDWQRAIRNGGLKGTQGDAAVSMAVAFVFSTYGNLDGTSIRPSYETVASDMDKSVRTVSRAVSTLIQCGYLQPVKAPAPGRPALYRLTLPADLNGKALESESAPVERPPAPALSADEAARVAAFEAAPDPYDQDDQDDQEDAPAAPVVDVWTSAEQANAAAPDPAPVEPPAVEPVDLSGVPDFGDDDADDNAAADYEDDEPEPELGRFAARAQRQAEQRYAAEREEGAAAQRHRPRYRNT